MVDSRKRIAGAFLIGGALVVGAFIVSAQEKTATQQGTIVTTAVERSFIPITDQNGDGTPDWRDALQKTEPIVLSEATSTYEKPTTITGKFALRFIEDLFRSKMYGAFGDSPEELIAQATEDLVKKSEDVLFTEEDITVTPITSTETLRAYGNHIAHIALSSKGGSDNEAIILQDTLRYNNPERLKDLEPIAASYVDVVKQMLEVPVPERYIKEHLDLLNAYNAIREDVNAMQKVYDDPLYTFVRMKRYEDDVLGMANALTQLFDALYLKDKIEWQEGENAARIMEVLKNI